MRAPLTRRRSPLAPRRALLSPLARIMIARDWHRCHSDASSGDLHVPLAFSVLEDQTEPSSRLARRPIQSTQRHVNCTALYCFQHKQKRVPTGRSERCARSAQHALSCAQRAITLQIRLTVRKIFSSLLFAASRSFTRALSQLLSISLLLLLLRVFSVP